MFGANKSTGFGGFGTSTSAFGSLGSTNTGFGGGASFGGQSNPSNLFGGASTSQTPATGGLFGQTASTGFGQPQAGNAFSFGATPSTNSGGGGLFGSTPQAGAGSLFSTPGSGTSFGSKPGGFGGFGTTTTQAGTGGLFGGANPGTQSFSFGGAAPSQGGTTIAFNPPAGQDTMMKSGVTTNINTRHQCITAMKEYETKCIEELRMEDYAANRKSKQAGGTATGGGGLFGQTQTTQPSSGGFMFGGGTAGATGLGATGTSGFGGFGQSSSAATTPFNQNRPLFGTATSVNTGFGLGTTTVTQQSGSLFGNTAKPLFGGTQTSQPALGGGSSFFGAQAGGTSTSIGGFGTSTQTGGLFGSKPTTGFGAATTSAGLGGFGAGGNLFGNKPTTTASSGFGFGTNTSASGFGAGTTGGLFNKPATGFGTTNTGLGGTGSTFGFGAGLGGTGTNTAFGANTSKPSGFGGGFNFGATNPAPGGFGSTLGTGTGNTFGGLGGGALALGTATAAPQNSNAQMGQHLLALASSPYGDNPLFWNLKQKTKEGREDVLKPTNPNAQKAVLSSANQYKVSPRPTAKIKPKSLHGLLNGSKAQLFEGLDDADSSFGDDTFVPRKSVKKLVLRKGSGNKSTSDSSTFYDVDNLNNSQTQPMPITRSSITDPLPQGDRDNENVISSSDAATPARDVPRNLPAQRLFADSTNLDDSLNGGHHNQSPRKEMVPPNRQATDLVSHSFASDNEGNVSSSNNRLAADMTASFLETSDLESSCLVGEGVPPHPTGIVMTRPDYYTIPTLDELTDVMDENGNIYVEDFTIGREGYGNLFFPGITNISGMNLDEIVHFRRKEVVVYPDDERKPPHGDGLNKKAQITLDCVWPTDKSSRTPIRSPERLKLINYAKKIEETTSRIGGRFVDYRIETGSWVFEVNHFSKYGLLDDDEDELTEQQKKLLAGHPNATISLAQKLKIQQENVPIKDTLKQQQQGQGDGLEMGFGLVEGEGVMGMEECDEDDTNSKAIIIDGTTGPGAAMKKMHPSVYDMEEDDFNSSLDSKYLASTMGVSARHIQGMKASFFSDDYGGYEGYGKKKADAYDEEMGAVWKKKEKSISSGLFGAFKHPGSLSLPQSPAFSDKERDGYDVTPFQKSGMFENASLKENLRPTPQTFLHPPVMEHPLIPSGLKTEDLPPRIVGTQVRHSFLHVKDSLLYKNQKSLVDAACVMGRSFRVGWGPSWTLSHCGYPMGFEEEASNEVSLLPSRKGKVPHLPRFKRLSAHLEKVQMAGYMELHNQTVFKQQEKLLQVQLDNSCIEVEDGCPLLLPQPGVEGLHQLSATLKSSLEDIGTHPDAIAQHQAKIVFTLCEALWGNLPDVEDLEKSEMYRESQLRHEALSAWLAEVSAARVADEMETNSAITTEGCLNAIFSKLSVREIANACMLAQKGRDHRLALLIAQAMGGPLTRQLLQTQLNSWADLDVCQFINATRQKIYCLLAGELVWNCEGRDINTCQGLDWKRALALHMWYKCPPNASIQQALSQYQTGFRGSEEFPAYCASPLPPYLEENEEEVEKDECLYDTTYHLISLYCDGTYGLEALLSPTSSTASHMDYRLSWHLLQILQALEYQHLSPEATNTIHTSFASQLESLGLWHWAVFVLLHIQDGYQRQKAVQALLQRYLMPGETFTEEENFLVEKLLIPAEWLHQAKAIRAHHEEDHHAEAYHLLQAKSWNKAHYVVLRHIAPDAIINDNHEYLRTFLDTMAADDCSVSILNWNGNGKVFLDFINLREKLKQLKQSQPSQFDLEALQPDVLSLCSRVKGLECRNAKDYLCQAEMAKTAASLVRTFLTLQDRSPTSILTKIISDLPIPEDFSLQELQALGATALMEIA